MWQQNLPRGRQPDAVGEPFELWVGPTSDIAVAIREVSNTSSQQPNGRRVRVSYEVTVTSAKAAPAVVEVRHPSSRNPGTRVRAESQAHGVKAGDPNWSLSLPANGSRTLRYSVEWVE